MPHAIAALPGDADVDLSDPEAGRNMTIKAIEIFRSRDSHSFEIAIAALLGIMRDSWEPDEYGSDETPFTPDAFSLLRSIKTQVLDW